MEMRNQVPRCVNGHVTVAVTRGTRLCWVCPECLRAAITHVGRREMTVSDYLTRLEGDSSPPQVSVAEAGYASELYRAAQEIHDDRGVTSCRKVIREAAKAAGVTSAEAMKWTLKELAHKGLPALRETLQAA